jgi:hypothetical protein
MKCLRMQVFSEMPRHFLLSKYTPKKIQGDHYNKV